jgi:hypothetical protein
MKAKRNTMKSTQRGKEKNRKKITNESEDETEENGCTLRLKDNVRHYSGWKISCRWFKKRYTVRVPEYDFKKVLGIVKLSSGTGQEQVKAKSELLMLWKVESILGMLFDTTASNTGFGRVACILLKNFLKRTYFTFLAVTTFMN